MLSLQAQYGVTDGISNEIRRWVDATNEWATTDTGSSITRIRAVRFSVVCAARRRSSRAGRQRHVHDDHGGASPWPDVAPMDLSADPDWGCYRYQVYASIAPLKNVVWSVSQ